MKTKIDQNTRRIKSKPMVLKEVTVAPGIGEVISVRSAKAHLSALLDLVAGGREITITSDGKPKAKLVSVEEIKPRKVFQGMGDYLIEAADSPWRVSRGSRRPGPRRAGLVMYLDTAIIVKLLVREAGQRMVRSSSVRPSSFESSELALAEVCAALLSKERAGDITQRERESAMGKFSPMVESEVIMLFPLNRKVIERAGGMQLACHPQIPLRTLDALHVATCDLHHSGTMSATDRRIRAACKQFGIALFPAEIEDIAIAK